VSTNKDEEPSGCDVLMRLARKLDEDSDWAVQLYYDRAERSVENIGFYHSCDTFDLDFQHRFPLGRRHSLIWGFGYRNTRNVSQGVYIVSFDPAVRSFGVLSYFVQDEITLRDDLLYLTVGSKFEHNDFSNFEYQPTVRLLWTPSERQSVWASVSRAARTPSRTEHDILVTGAPLGFSFAPPGATFMCIEGDPAVESEELLAYEIGVRTQPSDDFWWDLAVFYNDYENLVALTPATPFPPTPAFPPALWQMLYANAMRGETYGFELAAACQVNPCWKVQGGYSLLKMHLHADADASSDAEDAEGESPQNQVYLQSGWDLGRGVELDMTGRYVDGLPALGIPDYVVMDVRLAWSPTKTLEMAVVGRHLLDAAHAEFDEPSFYSSDVQSEVYGMVTWRR
jgi:iron complex outermembrane receptor protein